MRPPAGRTIEPPPLRVVMVDDHAMIIDSLTGYFESAQDGGRPVQVVGRAGSLREAVQVLGETQAHVVVVDVNLPDGNGLTLVERIRSRSATIGLVVLTMYEDDQTLLGARDAGASAMVRKSADAASILSAIRQAGEDPTGFNAEGVEAAAGRRAARPTLSPRELEVLHHIAEGDTVSDVAAALFMSSSTVKTHITKLYGKLGAHNRASAVRIAIDLGLVQPGRDRPR